MSLSPYNPTILDRGGCALRNERLATPGESQGPGRVLVVEDDPAVRNSLEAILSVDYKVESVSSLAAAQKALTETPYDAVVTDFTLGDGTGEAVIDTAGKLLPAPFVILLTGDIGRSDVRALNRAGRTLVLLKPVNPDELISWVKNGITMSRLSAKRQEIVAPTGNTPAPMRAPGAPHPGAPRPGGLP